MTLLIFFFLLSIGISFLCSILEAVLLSITPSFIRKQEHSNPILFEDLNNFKEDIEAIDESIFLEIFEGVPQYGIRH